MDEFMKFLINFCCNIVIPSIKKKIEKIISGNNQARVKIKEEVLKILKDSNVNPDVCKNVEKAFQEELIISDRVDVKMQEVFLDHSKIFDHFSTEYKRFSFLRRKGFIEPKHFKIGPKPIDDIKNEEIAIGLESMWGVYVPLQDTLKQFLEIPGMLSEILQYIQLLSAESRIIVNVIQGALWRTKFHQLYRDDVVIPLFIYYDELETGNALGSHAGKNKFGALYAYLGCLPPRIASKLDCIFFHSLIKANEKKISTNKYTFQQIIKELKFLQKYSIFVNDGNTKHVVKFQLITVLGDNAGLNEILGFVKSFKRDYFCRVCRCTLEETSNAVTEDISKLRTKENYAADVEKYNKKSCGVSELCVFTVCPGFT